MKCKHVIWDWNGTLLNDVWLCVKEINKVLIKYGKSILSLEKYRELFDFPVKDYYHRIGFDFSKESFEVVGTEFINGYNTHHLECKLRDDAFNTVKNLYDSGITQSILSARKQKQLEEEVRYHNLHSFINDIVGLTHHYATSKIDTGKKLVKKLKIASPEILLVGDTTHDYDVAKAIGTSCILISNGHQTIKKLKTCGVPVINSLRDIIEHVDIKQ